MKTRKILWMLTAILFCGVAAMFTSCTNEDNPVNPVDNLSEKIIGKWIVAEKGGQPVLTNEKAVYTFVSTTQAYISASFNTNPVIGAHWFDKIEVAVGIDGNKMTLTYRTEDHTTTVEELTVTAINGSEFTANRKITVTAGSDVVFSVEDVVRLVKQTTDYAEPILGLWECEGLIGDETYNDGNDRLEFLDDGTYRYYRQDDAGQWQAVTTREFQNYFVDGTLLATRWKNQGEDELREWWEIESLSGNEMVWTALRQNADGSTFQQKMTWKKIDLNIEEKIIGKWIAVDFNGEDMPTNGKAVYTFASTTKAFVSASYHSTADEYDKWNLLDERDVVINGNVVKLITHPDEHTTGEEEFTISDIDANSFTANYKVSNIVDGNVVFSRESIMHFNKVATDYSASIVGTWQGRCTSEGSVFDDGQEHRWQYKADGTYVYYVKDGDNWVPYATNTLNEYFVDGTLLCTRWIDNGVENREWWEITINGNKMNWTALRQNTDGTTFTATFEMKKVE